VHHDAQMAMLLGADAQSAERLAQYYWRVSYPQMPDNYRDPKCTYDGSMPS